MFDYKTIADEVRTHLMSLEKLGLVSFWLHGCCGECMGRWARKPVNHTSWVAVVTPTDRPKSVRNRCLIELFCGVVCVVTLPFWHFCWCRGFCHRTGSDLLLFVLRFSLRTDLQRSLNCRTCTFVSLDVYIVVWLQTGMSEMICSLLGQIVLTWVSNIC